MARLNQAETTHPLRPDLRTTASVTYVRPTSTGHWATSMIWGRNVDLAYTQLPGLPVIPRSGVRPLHVVSVPTRIPRQIYNSYLAESTLKWKRNWFWGRVESADRDSTFLYTESPFVLLIDEQRLARVQAFTGGYERELPIRLPYLNTGVGGQVTFYRTPSLFDPIYGAHPVEAQVFLRVRLGH
jgi:hypothetical protein